MPAKTYTMSNKTRSVIRIVAVILVLLAVMMHIGWVSIAGVSVYRFWMVVLAFGLMLAGSK
jgi:hypothetical protein